MLISVNWLREFVDFDFNLEELDNVLTMLGVEVESVIDYNKKYDKFFTAHVLTCEKHPKADKLSLCTVTTGGEEVHKIVCGAPNVAAGQKVILGTLGAVVPVGGFKLEKRKIRDYESCGMICAQTELDCGDDDSGIWVLPEDTPIGVPLAKFLNMDDIVLEVGLTPNKADCLSHLGIARELAAKLRQKVRMPLTKPEADVYEIGDMISVDIQSPENCPRYSCRIVKDVTIKESPDWLKNKLIKVGLRPVNAAVDVTNLILMEQGQPLHAFDYDTIDGKKIIVRNAKADEKFTTLDGKERTLDDTMLMICSESRSLAVGGVMGGENSEITGSTKTILLESAYFNPTNVRRTAKKLGIMSDSSYRFERGTDVENVLNCLDRAAQLIAELCDGHLLGGAIDMYPNPIKNIEVIMRYAQARKVIGIDISNAEMKEMLLAFGFKLVQDNDESITVEVPHRRNDIFGEIDLIEEIARLFNYDNITPDFTSTINFSGEGVHSSLAIPPLRAKINKYMIARGFNQILTQNMVDPRSAALFTDNPVAIANPLGEELSLLRPSMIPSALKVISANHRKGNQSVKLFEIGKSFENVDAKTPTFIPGKAEKEEMVITITGNYADAQWGTPDRKVDFFDLKGIAEELIANFRWNFLKFAPIAEESKVFTQNTLCVKIKNEIVGYIGEINKPVLKQYDIELPVYMIWLNLKPIYNAKQTKPYYAPVSPYPAVTRDLAFVLNSDINAGDLLKDIQSNAGKYLKNVNIFDLYAGKNIGEGKKSIAFSLSYQAPDKTLVDSEVEESINKVVSSIETKFGAQLRKQ